MKINSINENNYRQNFGAIKVARARITTDAGTKLYHLYNLERHDQDFLRNLYNKIDVEKRYPGLSDTEYSLWDYVLDVGLRGYYDNRIRKGLLLANQDKIPCGVMKYEDNKAKANIKYFATWPIEVSQRVPLAGKTLMLEFFRQILDNPGTRIVELNALKYSAFSPISKYMEMGFKMVGGTDGNQLMHLKLENIPAVIEKFKNKIKIMPLTEPRKVLIDKDLNIQV